MAVEAFADLWSDIGEEERFIHGLLRDLYWFWSAWARSEPATSSHSRPPPVPCDPGRIRCGSLQEATVEERVMSDAETERGTESELTILQQRTEHPWHLGVLDKLTPAAISAVFLGLYQTRA